VGHADGDGEGREELRPFFSSLTEGFPDSWFDPDQLAAPRRSWYERGTPAFANAKTGRIR
jgi:hypothetical protein